VSQLLYPTIYFVFEGHCLSYDSVILLVKLDALHNKPSLENNLF